MSRRTWLILGALGVVLLVLLLIRPGWAYQWEWTGFGPGRGPAKDPKHPFDYYPAKSLWDWMQLLVVPLALAVAALWFNWTEKRRDQRIVQETRTADQTIVEERQQEAALGEYLATMTTLLLDKGLRTSAEGDEVRAVARAQTHTVLRRLNGERKGSVMRFLYESRLIDLGTPIVVLVDADLSEADLSRTTLHRANLSGANLTTAVLTDAILTGAWLDKADLNGADLVRANLASASLDGATLLAARLWSANLSGAVLGKVGRGAALLDNFLVGEAVVDGPAVGGANLRDANLNDAILREAILAGVVLINTSLRGADLTRAIGTTPEQLQQAASLEGAIMPDGSIHP